MKKFQEQMKAKKAVIDDVPQFFEKKMAFSPQDYLATFQREKLYFLNDSARVLPNGNASALPPPNTESLMNIKLYTSIKDKMDSEQHRKLQHMIRYGKEDYTDKRDRSENEV